MKQSNMRWILILAAVGLLCGGCDVLGALLPARPVYVGPGEAVELAYPRDIKGWVQTEDGKQLRTVEAQAGWYVGRLPPDRGE